MNTFVMVSILICFSKGYMISDKESSNAHCVVEKVKYVKADRIQEMSDDVARVCKSKSTGSISYETLTKCHLVPACSIYGLEGDEYTLVNQKCSDLLKGLK